MAAGGERLSQVVNDHLGMVIPTAANVDVEHGRYHYQGC